MWNTTNYKGEPVTWYSEEDIKSLKNKLYKIKSVCSDIYTRTQEAKSIKKVVLEIIGSEDATNEK